VPAERADSVAAFRAAFARALTAPGPMLIEAMV